ncbi:hypothetical protein [Burkholderia sp. BCC0405]|uniref:hypothetical protein n=1 Tax=Burkholderia sp. BCC0405 TaxID=2676298 RepID=UPI00158B3155|nr:hypothetical protein [Burkholderia sp. BCC0405]
MEHISQLTRSPASPRTGAALINPVPPSLASAAWRHIGFTVGQSILAAFKLSSKTIAP